MFAYHMIRNSALCGVFLLAACGGSPDSPAPDPGAPGEIAGNDECVPLETRPTEDPGQSPAFEGQTRACGVTSNVSYQVTVITDGLEHPWAVEPLPGGDLLVTERPGRMRIISANGEMGDPITGLPEVDARDQGGLLDAALSPNFAQDRIIYWSYAEPRSGGNGTAVARGVLAEDRASVADVEVLFRAMPTYDGTLHYGSRLAFGPDGMLYITTGERSDRETRMHAQELDNHLGKIVRIAPDGSIPQDNPFVNEAGAQPEVWTYGHRNTQSAVFAPDGRFWIVEHGARGGDELNLVEPGNNYGWPVEAYGIEYSGDPIETAETQRTDGDFVQPVYYWDPVIAPSGMEWYTGNAFPEWQGSVFVGGLASTRLVRIEIEGDRVTGEEHLLEERGQRIRDVRQGPDGSLYIVTDEEAGELWRLSPGG